MPSTYPANDLQRPDLLLGLLGSFWSSTYEGTGQARALCEATAEIYLQTVQNLAEAVETISRHTCPILHRKNWTPLWLSQTQGRTQMARFGDGLTMGETDAKYGLVYSAKAAYPLPLEKAPLIVNRIANPSVSLIENLDFTLDAGMVRFHTDPFSDPRISVRPVFDASGIVIDQEALLWVYGGEEDWHYMYEHFGYVLGVRSSSTEGYAQLVNALFDSLVGGSSELVLRMAVAAVTGVPITREPLETVELIHSQADAQIVVTDAHAYRLPADSGITVEIGDELKAGSELCDAFHLYRLNRGQLPPITAVGLWREMLPDGFVDAVVFYNREVPLEVDASGETTRLSFELGGFPLDVEAFWDLLASKEDAQGHSLAELLDTRAEVTSQPTALTLPTTINPMAFLVENVLSANALLLHVKSGSIPNSYGLQWHHLLRRIVPPHNCLLTVIEMPLMEDSGSIQQDADELESLPAFAVIEDSPGGMPGDDLIRARLVRGYCQ